MNVEFREIRYVIPCFTQFMLFVTPVIFPYGDVQVGWKRALLTINPMSGVVEGFRWCLLRTPLPIHLVVCSAVITLGLLASGLFYFRRMEKNFADVIYSLQIHPEQVHLAYAIFLRPRLQHDALDPDGVLDVALMG